MDANLHTLFPVSRSPILELSQQQLRMDSIVQELTLFGNTIEIDCPGRDLTHIFNQVPLLPGILLTQAGQLVGMLSRRTFFEQMSRPFGLELFSRRPIQILHDSVATNPLILSGQTSIVAAARRSLQRELKYLYDPIVIQLDDGTHRLVDVHQLLLAQSQIQELTMQSLQQARDTLEQRVEERTQELTEAIAHLQQAQLQLVQSEKMSSLGELVAGVAHEINNPVNFIYGNLPYATDYIQRLLNLVHAYQLHYPEPPPTLQTAIDDTDPEFLAADLPRLLSSIRVGAERIREIVRSLRTFSRLDEAEVKAVNIHEGIDSTLMILHNRLKAQPHRSEIQVLRDYGDLPLIQCYSGQLNQVFMNILANAIDALDEKFQAAPIDPHNSKLPQLEKVPQILIRTTVFKPDWVAIELIDNGTGMPESVIQKLFNPFFTTKSVGKGTGLGLSISYQIVVEKHGGQLRCESEPGKGTIFKLEIPIYHPRFDRVQNYTFNAD